MKDDFTVRRSEHAAELRGFGSRVAVGKIEDEAVWKDAGSEIEDGETVAEGLRINGKMQKSPWLLAQIGIEKPERVFEIPALSLEVVRTEMHSFRPDDPREELHSRDTTMCKSWISGWLPDRRDAKLQRQQPGFHR